MPAHTASESQTLSAPDPKLWIQTIPPTTTIQVSILTDQFLEPRLLLPPATPAPVMPATTAGAMWPEVRTTDPPVHGINHQGT